MLLVGSGALSIWCKDVGRAPSDLDYICTIEEYEEFVSYHKESIRSAMPTSDKHFVVKGKSGAIYEFEIAWPGSTAEEILNYTGSNRVAPLEILLLLKLSHRYLRNSPHFLKTMNDIKFLRSKGAKVPQCLKPVLRRREKETYTYSHPVLNKSKIDFFEDSFYIYDHDSIHRAIAVDSTPAYTKFSKEGSEVEVDRDKWDALPLRVKLLAGLEESYVLALERSIIPSGKLTPKQAFDIALMKVCTSITSGWFREFCWEHYTAISEMYDESFVTKFHTALASGLILKHNDNTNS